MKYTIDQNKKHLLSSIVILDSISSKCVSYTSQDGKSLSSYEIGGRTVMSITDIQKLKPIFDRMISSDLLTVDKNHYYLITDKGGDLLDNFYDRYNEFLKFYDIFCAVDLTLGEFAFEKIFDMTDEEFDFYINDTRWVDLRVAVCEFKKIDPIQMVFLSFLRDGKIDVHQNNWVDELTSESIWSKIIDIVDSSISMETLMVDDQIKNIIERGSILLKELLEREKYIDGGICETETIVTTTTEENMVEDDYDDMMYYAPYCYDPFYISPCWGYYYDYPYWW